MELREVLSALRASWWLPLLCLIVASGGSLGASMLQTPMYTASTQLFVSTADSDTTSALIAGSVFSEQRVTSYAQLITGRELAGRVIDRLDLDMSPGEVVGKISVTALTDTVLINVDVTDYSPQRAQRIAAAVGSEFAAYAEQLEAPGPNGISPVRVTVTEQPQLPSASSSPKTARNVALGALLGLVAGTGIAIARARLDRSVKGGEDASQLAQAPLIGTVMRDAGLEKDHLVNRTGPSRAAEDYRQLRNNLQFLNVDEPPRVILVSSALPSEGKTTAVVNLALALVDADRRVTVVEADLRRPKVTRYLGLVGGVGLTNLLAGTAELDEVVQVYRESGLRVIAAGPTPPNPGELLASSHMAELLDKLRSTNDYVLIDAPPLLPVADASGLAVHTDGVVLSVRYGATARDELRLAAATVRRVGSRTLGVILNIAPPKAGTATGYGYEYDLEEPRKGVKRHRARAMTTIGYKPLGEER